MSEYPEHDKLREIAPLSQAIGEFLEWCSDVRGLVLAQWEDDGRLWQAQYQPNRLLAEHFNIDLVVLEEEKRAMLDRQREMNHVDR